MTLNSKPVDFLAELRQAQARILDLERQQSRLYNRFRNLDDANLSRTREGHVPTYRTSTGLWDPAPPFADIIFSLGDASTPVAVRESARWYPPVDCELSGYLGSLFDDGTSTTTFAIRKNGTVVTGGTVNLASGVFKVSGTLTGVEMLAGTDYLTVACTAAGTAALGLVVQPRLRGIVG